MVASNGTQSYEICARRLGDYDHDHVADIGPGSEDEGASTAQLRERGRWTVLLPRRPRPARL